MAYIQKNIKYYFNETDEFIFIDRSFLETIKINNFDNSVKLCREQFFGSQQNEYAIIYVNRYKAVNYSSFSNYYKCHNISSIEEEIILTSKASISV